MTIRVASHAGSWYNDDGSILSKELEDWLANVNPRIDDLGVVPLHGARVIIAPYVFVTATDCFVVRPADQKS